jgi:hypothetical protein
MKNEHADLVEVIINGQPFDVPKGEISFAAVVSYVFPAEENPDARYAVTYEHSGNDKKPDGILVVGQTVKVKKDMIFVVSPTGQS